YSAASNGSHESAMRPCHRDGPARASDCQGERGVSSPDALLDDGFLRRLPAGRQGMADVKGQLAKWIDDDRDTIVDFLSEFVRGKSPTPPGDTRLAAAHVTRFLERHGLPFRVIAPEPTMPNVVASFDTGRPGHHLVLNGHMDVFPADALAEGWTHDPWG